MYNSQGKLHAIKLRLQRQIQLKLEHIIRCRWALPWNLTSRKANLARRINTLWPDDACMHQWTGPSAMACCPCSVKPLPEPMLTSYQGTYFNEILFQSWDSSFKKMFFENVICIMSAIMFRHHCIKSCQIPLDVWTLSCILDITSRYVPNPMSVICHPGGHGVSAKCTSCQISNINFQHTAHWWRNNGQNINDTGSTVGSCYKAFFLLFFFFAFFKIVTIDTS